MPSTLPNSNPLSYYGVQAENPPNVIREARAPMGTDTRGPNGPFPIGTIWVDVVARNFYGLANSSAGNAEWTQFAASTTGDAPISKYIVDQGGEADYVTIQAALDAANADGGGTVYVRPATYTENLTLYDQVTIVGATSSAEASQVQIVGTHTPPTSGVIGFSTLELTGTAAIISSAAAGSTEIHMFDCVCNVSNGYTLDLDNWTGLIDCFNVDARGADDGFFNNSSGSSTINFISSQLGDGFTQPMRLGGTGFAISCRFEGLIELIGTANIEFQFCVTRQTIELFSTSTIQLIQCHCSTGFFATTLVLNATSIASVIHTVLDGFGTPVISGTGTLFIGNVSFPNGDTLDAALTINYEGSLSGATQLYGNLSLPEPATQLQIEGGAATDFVGQVTLVAGTATVANTNIAATDRILLQRQTPNGSSSIGLLRYGINAGVDFTVRAVLASSPNVNDSNDVSTINYFIFREL